MPADIPDVSLKFRIAPLFAILALLALAPFGVPFAVVGSVFATGLLGLCVVLGLRKSIDFVLGLVLTLVVFAAQFLAAVFLGINAGGSPQTMVFTTVLVWFLQLLAVAADLYAFGTPVAERTPSQRDAQPARNRDITS